MNYYCFEDSLEIDQVYVNEALAAQYTWSHRPHQLRAFSSFNNSNIVKRIREEFGSDIGGLYLKNLPSSYYDWHVDIKRQCSLNWLITPPNGSLTLYRKLIDPLEGNKSIMYETQIVKYVPYKPTLLDVTKEHCVINHSNSERIIFSLSMDIPFNTVKDFLCGIKNI